MMGLKAAARKEIEDVAGGRDCWSGALGAASRLYGLGVRIQDFCLNSEILSVRRLPRPVISVGNLTAGGTGKTPLVICLAQLLSDADFKVAILSRGHGRKQGNAVQLVSEGRGPLCGVEEAGDEPFMMAQRLQGVHIWVGKHRHQAGLRAWKEVSPDVFLLDDGFQHRRLHRDLDVVVIRVPRPFGNGNLLPAGPLREPTKALQRADLLIVNATDDAEGGKEDVHRLATMFPSVPIFRAVYEPRCFRHAGDERQLPLDTLAGRSVALVCGIGRPDSFKRIVCSLGARVVKSLFFPDHYWYTPEDVTILRQSLDEVDAVVTTEKDSWKLKRAGVGNEPVLALQADMMVEKAHDLNRRLIYCLTEAKGR